MDLSVKYDHAVDLYIQRIMLNNLSPKTIEDYKKVLWRFGDFLREYEDPEDFFAVVEAWRDHLTESGAKPSTVRQYLNTLKIFFERTTRRSFPKDLRFDENPVDEDMFPKVVKRPYEEILTDDQVVMIYSSAPPPNFPMWERNYAMLCILINEKIRNAELLDLRLCDLDFVHHELTVQSGKGRKMRVVDMTELTEQAIARYLDSGVRPSYLSDEDYLFGTTAAHKKGEVNTRSGAEKWHRGSGAWLSSVVERTVKAITGTPSVRSHDLRHVGSRICLNAGQSLEELQGQLGHSQISTTQIYSDKLLQRRRRESAKAVLAARDAVAEEMKKQSAAPEQLVIPFPA